MIWAFILRQGRVNPATEASSYRKISNIRTHVGVLARTNARGVKDIRPRVSPFMSLVKNSSNFLFFFYSSEGQYHLSTFNSLVHSACLSTSFTPVKVPLKIPSLLSWCERWSRRRASRSVSRGVGLQCRDFPLAESQHGRGNAIRAELRMSQGTHGPDHGPVTR